MKMTRRTFLTASGVGVAGIALGGGYSIQRSLQADYSQAAYQYWNAKNKRIQTDFEYMVMCGVLAANPHNTQAWKFDLKDNHIDVYADLSRHLGFADPQRRMMLVGVGCALENMRIAATKLGYGTRIERLADHALDVGGLCARLHLEPNQVAKQHPLFDSIFTRQTTRNEYSMDAVDQSFLNDLAQLNDLDGVHLNLVTDEKMIRSIADLHREGVRRWTLDEARHKQEMKWWRYTREELYEKRDGISFYTGAAPLLVKKGLEVFVTPEMMDGDFGIQGEVDFVDTMVAATPCWGCISIDTRDNDLRVKAGQLTERIYLEVARQDYRINPMIYVTEIHELARQFKLDQQIPVSRELVLAFRLGKSDRLEYSVRRDLQTFIS
jgi:hypothetical protein